MDLDTLRRVQDNFFKELTEANKGKQNSLAFIHHQIPAVSLVKDGETFQVMVIGGSVCRKALVKKINGELKISNLEFIEENLFVTNQDLFVFIKEHLDKDVKVLALNFAYPIKPIFERGRLDGILLAGTKENSFGDLIGKKIGENLEQYLEEKLGRVIKISLANDTICLLLSGLTKYPWKALVSGIVGTGTNFAFFLKENTLVNLESGNFDKFPLSDEVKEIDKASSSPGKYLFEKEIAGAYIYKHFNIKIEREKLNCQKITSTRELDNIIKDSERRVSNIAKAIMERSADLIAAAVGGIAKFKDQDLMVCMDGSLFWKGLGYKDRVQVTLQKLVPNHKIDFVYIEDNTILGAAELVAHS